MPGGGTLSRKEIDDYTTFVKIYGAGGLAYIKVNDVTKVNEEGLQSPIVKFLGEPTLREILVRTGAANGDLIFFGADREKVVNDALGALRAKVGHDRGFAEAGWKPLWVVDFPMFEFDDDKKTWAARHHPFTAPKDGHEDLFATDPGRALAKAYDVVLNGWEIGGGSVRIHRPEVQAKVFAALGISPEDQQKKFGFLLNALQYGAPPHGGIAFGFDRHRHADVRRRLDPRRDRVSEDAARTGPADRHADAGHRAAVARPAHQGAADGLAGLLRYTGCP